ncbi:MAG: HAD hydrolase family protein [Brachymonas sp.]|nr:HAD hydrolase family protein [Brachymonas sp.]
MSRQISQPALNFSPEILLRAQQVRLLIMDVDGVLTDGGLYFSEMGEALKRFSVLDGQGIKLLARVGIELAVISGRDSAALRTRFQALRIGHAILGTEDKLPAAQALLAQIGLTWQQVAVMGDDWPDLPLLSRSALACSPANAHAQNKALAHYVTHARGGEGAVREMCDLILTAQGHYARLLQEAAL